MHACKYDVQCAYSQVSRQEKSESKKSITVHHLNYYEHLCGYLGLITERKLNGHRSSVDDPYYHHRTWIDPGGNFNIST